MPKIPGMEDFRRGAGMARLMTENKRLSALLWAVLRKTGPVTLTSAEAREVQPDAATLRIEEDQVSGDMKLWVE